jgi:COMPASS component SWD3
MLTMFTPSADHAEQQANAGTASTIQPIRTKEFEHSSGGSKLSQRPDYRLKFTMGGHTMSISSIKFSPDGAMLASAGVLPIPSVVRCCSSKYSRKASDKLIKLWDSYTGEIVRTLDGHTDGISDIAWSSDSNHLASASDDKTLRIWKPSDVC